MIRILAGDCREVLKALPNASVHCVVTSPPYFGLRDYGTAQWEGGDPQCSHLAPATGSTQNKSNNGKNGTPFRDICGMCGARRIDSQIGLEQSPQEYVEQLVAVFREVRRVLRDDGTVWLNLGDSYAGGKTGRADGERNDVDGFTGGQKFKGESFKQRAVSDGLKPKDLIGIPWRVAFALQADGWYLRQDIIWAKPNPMPESVTDRCTKAHEYIFLLSKSARYYYDAAAIAEEGSGRCPGNVNYKYNGLIGHETKQGILAQSAVPQLTRNKRSVWEVATQPYSEAHFATFPPALIEPCIKAGCPKGGTVLDPFGGAGTTGLVADRFGRNAVLIELNPQYVDMTEQRIKGDAGMFAQMVTA